MEMVARRRRNSPKMEERRQRILEAARSIIIEGGMDRLNMRALATAADVAIRTIYSLLGKKDDILVALYGEFQESYMDRVEMQQNLSPMEKIEEIVTQAVDLAATDEQCYRAAYLVIEHLDDVKPRSPATDKIFETSDLFIASRFRTAIADGLLKGTISSERLGAVMVHSYRVLWRKWASGRISLAQLRSEGLISLWIVLLADATPDAHAQLSAKLAASER